MYSSLYSGLASGLEALRPEPLQRVNTCDVPSFSTPLISGGGGDWRKRGVTWCSRLSTWLSILSCHSSLGPCKWCVSSPNWMCRWRNVERELQEVAVHPSIKPPIKHRHFYFSDKMAEITIYNEIIVLLLASSEPVLVLLNNTRYGLAWWSGNSYSLKTGVLTNHDQVTWLREAG